MIKVKVEFLKNTCCHKKGDSTNLILKVARRLEKKKVVKIIQNGK